MVESPGIVIDHMDGVEGQQDGVPEEEPQVPDPPWYWNHLYPEWPPAELDELMPGAFEKTEEIERPISLHYLQIGFPGCSDVTDAGLSSLSKVLPKSLSTLRLELSACISISDEGIKPLAKRLDCLHDRPSSRTSSKDRSGRDRRYSRPWDAAPGPGSEEETSVKARKSRPRVSLPQGLAPVTEEVQKRRGRTRG